MNLLDGIETVICDTVDEKKSLPFPIQVDTLYDLPYPLILKSTVLFLTYSNLRNFMSKMPAVSKISRMQALNKWTKHFNEPAINIELFTI